MLYAHSIARICINSIICGSDLYIMQFAIYKLISYMHVEIATIIIIVILLSFEKFLSNVPPIIPIIPSIIAVSPTLLPMKKSNKTPNPTPYIAPTVLVQYNPINSIKITNKFGITPAILNHEKKLTVRRYRSMKTNIKLILIITFFNFIFFPFSCKLKSYYIKLNFYSFVITRTVSSFSKSTAVVIIPYLSDKFFVFTIFDTTPM